MCHKGSGFRHAAIYFDDDAFVDNERASAKYLLMPPPKYELFHALCYGNRILSNKLS